MLLATELFCFVFNLMYYTFTILTHMDIFGQTSQGLWENISSTLAQLQVSVFYLPKQNLCTDSISQEDSVHKWTYEQA